MPDISHLTIPVTWRTWYTIECTDAGYIAHCFCTVQAGDPAKAEPVSAFIPPLDACPTFDEAVARAEERLAAIRSRLND